MKKSTQETTHPNVAQLGKQTPLPESPETALLERVPNPHADTFYLTRFVQPEFTSLCPVTGQPDFAHLVIDYVPNKWLVESKSLKLYLSSFRNHGAFHEDCTVSIGKRVAELLCPHYLRIGGYWFPRGGMPIDVFWQTGKCPDGVWLPDQGVASYRGAVDVISLTSVNDPSVSRTPRGAIVRFRFNLSSSSSPRPKRSAGPSAASRRGSAQRVT